MKKVFIFFVLKKDIYNMDGKLLMRRQDNE